MTLECLINQLLTIMLKEQEQALFSQNVLRSQNVPMHFLEVQSSIITIMFKDGLMSTVQCIKKEQESQFSCGIQAEQPIQVSNKEKNQLVLLQSRLDQRIETQMLPTKFQWNLMRQESKKQLVNLKKVQNQPNQLALMVQKFTAQMDILQTNS